MTLDDGRRPPAARPLPSPTPAPRIQPPNGPDTMAEAAAKQPLGKLTWGKVLEAVEVSDRDLLEEEELGGFAPGRGLASRPKSETDVEDRVYTLDLHNRGVTSLAEGSISRLRRLRSLDLSFNEIVKISGVDRVTTLRELKLYNNKIEDVTPLCTLHGRSALERLYLHGNVIASLPPTSMLKSLRMLRELRLDGNKLTSLNNSGFLSQEARGNRK